MLNNSRVLLEEFGEELLSLKRADERLWLLLDWRNSRFTATIPAIASAPVTDDNHSQLDAIKDFVIQLIDFARLHFEGNMDFFSGWLHQLVQDLLRLWLPEERGNLLFRNNSLAKTLLAYELAYFPRMADQHFFDQSGVLFNRLQQLSEDENRSLRYVILNPQIDFFKNPEAERRGRSLSSPAPAVMTSPTIELSRRSSWSSFFSSAPKSYQKQLVALVTHYSHPMRQGHEQLFNQDKLALANGSKRSSRAEAKAAIAQALLDALEQSGDENLPHVFKANLTSWELNEAAFFEGKTSKILSTEFVSLLKGEAPKNTAHSGSFS